MKKPLIILTGPTAVGKTDLSIKLAKAVNGEIISADSMQVYKHMNIGTAKIMPSEMSGIKHYLIDEFAPQEDFNVVKFKEYAEKYMAEIYANNKVPIIAGGTGFYIQAVLYGIDFEENEEDTSHGISYRKELEDLAQEKGALYIHSMLQEADPAAACSIHPNNIKRVIRALEYYKQTGNKISEHNAEQRQKESPYNFCYFVLNNKREVLYERINKRVDVMIEQGLLEEVKHLLDMGCTKDMVSMQGLGYKEIIEYLEGKCTFQEAVYILKRDTRHFAKRQLTWFKREKDVIWVNKDQYNDNDDKVLEAMIKEIKLNNLI
ncbi:tRNA (adenosine(37)-N6)-dimethylallyltransferase MiaA [Anaerocolumna aminovalerica]|jgi:tRNA dimethylallyltransferase|uniref:tRNA dimethylallyltransferase n=1 Tax=Anaerocolumna aminovalerica TaxID=1527 RepID=A0A1I5CJ87_9FIRM|nr:tRNA (adenosine(37)-N6)-dimethylallyltransferase MiaA [Anaerocolumna aminovalerica]MBU5332612.1 tRNA (adenosine(37)-N6)-dimethylallyltransferase MiaA [Anaerocolumna aminovalerica]SFN87059.1 tRNA dimethylallyltransferase [Anaerocolumna aminovalerica]